MHTTSPRGITLLETVLYIGLMMIVLPMMVTFILRLHERQTLFDARTRMEQTAAVVLHELQTTLTAADAVTVSTSTLSVNPSVLHLTDGNGALVVIDAPTVSTEFVGGTQNVLRLRMQTGTNPAVWLTDSDIDVAQWHVTTLRDSASVLTGLRINFDMAMIAPAGDVNRSAAFAGDTSIALSPHTIEN